MISQGIVDLVPDRATLQIGIGGAPNAICASLTSHKDISIHTELMMPTLWRFSIRCSDEPLQKPSIDTRTLSPVDYVNDPCVIGKNDHAISISAFLEVGLDGAASSEAVEGRQYSAPGDQLDFVRGHNYRRAGSPILAAHLTAPKWTISRIVPKIQGPITDPLPPGAGSADEGDRDSQRSARRGL